MRFRLLGDVAVFHGDVAVDIGHAKQRGVLAVLLVDADRVVSVDSLLDRVWADRPPRHARNALSGYVSRLRQLLAGHAELVRAEGGYRLTVDPLSVDLHRFRHLVAEARTAPDPVAHDRFTDALELWHGTAFATLDTPWLARMRATLAAERLAATLDRNDVALRLGRHAELLGELSTLATTHPLDERIAGQLMHALYRGGRQADALRHYELIRTALADELGADPSPPLRELHRRILTADPGLILTQASDRPVPRQLPAPPHHFTGRVRELDLLDTAAADDRLAILTITGIAGIGKTALALHWAHREAGRFPDGQLYVDLRGSGTADEALHGFLDALGVPAHRVPREPGARAALYRSLLATRRMLVVLDDARDAEQVRALLPGASASVVVVTSRDGLTGLVVNDGARHLTLGPLDDADARALLAARIGAGRVAAEPAAVTELVARCAGLPLALATVAATLATRHSIREVAEDLRDIIRRYGVTSTQPLCGQ